MASKTAIAEDVLHAIEMDMYAPSFNEVIKIADVLDISIDFLAGKISQKIDAIWLDRLEDIQLMSDENKEVLIHMIDVLIRSDKATVIYKPTDTKIKVKKIRSS